jgi:molecular chaperone HtpG
LKDLLLPDTSESVSVEDVINRIVTIRTEKESSYRRYFEVQLDGVWNETGITDIESVREYLVQHAPVYYSRSFKWGRTIEEKIRLNGYSVPQYHVFLNNSELFKPYQDTFLSDRVKRNIDLIQDVIVETFYRGEILSAVLWYGKTSFFGTIIDPLIKGIRIRQGNILIGDKGSCNPLFKEERFNGWMIGELHILDREIIVNSRRDGFEKNAAYFELMRMLKDWAADVSKEIRHVSYARNLTNTKKAIAEADGIDELNDENELCLENLDYAADYNESSFLDTSESSELAETDFISKLGLLIHQKKAQTKYNALNINPKLTIEQRKTLERVFDIITQEYEKTTAEKMIVSISSKF